MAVKIGFIGCGGIANHHMRTLAGNADAQMVAFSDPDVARAKAAAKQFGGKAFSSYRTMISKGGMDAIFMCVPPFAHTDQERLCAEAGLAFFTEKPIGLSLKRVAQNAELFKKKGIITSVGYNWRYSDGAAMMKKALAGKKLAVVSGYWVGGTPGVMWWRQMKQSGGQVVEQTTHIFDMCRYVGGEVDLVFASGISGLTSQKDMPLYDVHDASVVQLRYKSGAVGNITSSCIVSQGVGTQVRVYARDLVVVVGGGKCEISIPGEERVYNDARNPTAHEHEAFIAAVAKKKGPPILSDYADAMESLRVTLAANKSMETGKPVKL